MARKTSMFLVGLFVIMGTVIGVMFIVWIGALKAVKNPARSEKYLDRGQPKIAVAMLEGESLEQLQAQFSEATTAMYVQADRLADLNKWVLEIALEPEIAKLAGL